MSTYLPISYATRNLGRSRTRLALAVGGALLVSLLAMGGAGFAIGMDRALRASGLPGNVVLLGAGSEESVERSEISPANAGVIAASIPGIAVPRGVECLERPYIIIIIIIVKGVIISLCMWTGWGI